MSRGMRHGQTRGTVDSGALDDNRSVSTVGDSIPRPLSAAIRQSTPTGQRSAPNATAGTLRGALLDNDPNQYEMMLSEMNRGPGSSAVPERGAEFHRMLSEAREKAGSEEAKVVDALDGARSGSGLGGGGDESDSDSGSDDAHGMSSGYSSRGLSLDQPTQPMIMPPERGGNWQFSKVPKGKRRSTPKLVGSVTAWGTIRFSHVAAKQNTSQQKSKAKASEPVRELSPHVIKNAPALVDPNSAGMRYFDIVIGVLLVFTATWTPFDVAFREPGYDVMFIFNRVVDLVFTIDIFLRFFTPYYSVDDALWILDHLPIAINYAKTWLIADVISVIPVEWILLAAGDSNEIDQAGALLRSVRLLRLLKLARLLRTTRLLRKWQVQLEVSFANAEIVRFLATVTIVIHWMACAWRMIIDLEDARTNWAVQYFGLHTTYSLSTIPASSQWVAALHWAAAVVTSTGFGDVVPTTDMERALTVVSMLIGASIYAYVVGAACAIVSRMDEATTIHHQQMDNLNRYMAENSFPTALRTRLRAYFSHTRLLRRAEYYQGLLKAMSPKLRGEVAMFTSAVWLAKIPVFQVTDRHERDQLYASLSVVMKPKVYSPREIVVHRGEEATHMYMIQRGTATMNGRGGFAAPMFRVLTAGDHFGVDFTLHGEHRQYQVLAMTFLDVYTLEQKTVEKILVRHNGYDFPTAMRRFRRAGIKLALRRAFVRCAYERKAIERARNRLEVVEQIMAAVREHTARRRAKRLQNSLPAQSRFADVVTAASKLHALAKRASTATAPQSSPVMHLPSSEGAPLPSTGVDENGGDSDDGHSVFSGLSEFSSDGLQSPVTNRVEGARLRAGWSLIQHAQQMVDDDGSKEAGRSREDGLSYPEAPEHEAKSESETPMLFGVPENEVIELFKSRRARRRLRQEQKQLKKLIADFEKRNPDISAGGTFVAPRPSSASLASQYPASASDDDGMPGSGSDFDGVASDNGGPGSHASSSRSVRSTISHHLTSPSNRAPQTHSRPVRPLRRSVRQLPPVRGVGGTGSATQPGGGRGSSSIHQSLQRIGRSELQTHVRQAHASAGGISSLQDADHQQLSHQLRAAPAATVDSAAMAVGSGVRGGHVQQGSTVPRPAPPLGAESAELLGSDDARAIDSPVDDVVNHPPRKAPPRPLLIGVRPSSTPLIELGSEAPGGGVSAAGQHGGGAMAPAPAPAASSAARASASAPSSSRTSGVAVGAAGTAGAPPSNGNTGPPTAATGSSAASSLASDAVSRSWQELGQGMDDGAVGTGSALPEDSEGGGRGDGAPLTDSTRYAPRRTTTARSVDLRTASGDPVPGPPSRAVGATTARPQRATAAPLALVPGATPTSVSEKRYAPNDAADRAAATADRAALLRALREQAEALAEVRAQLRGVREKVDAGGNATVVQSALLAVAVVLGAIAAFA